VARRYRMDTRAAAVEETRRRIVEAAKTLHAEQGVLGTNYEEIARRAGTSQATVYRHFPSLGELLPACARSIHVLQPLTPARARATFHGMEHPSLRVEVLVRGTCECYARDAGWLHAARREEDLFPALHEIVRVQRENLRLLARAALAGTEASERTVRVVAALVDFPVWQALRDAGLSDTEATAQVLELVRVTLIHEDIL
jgi:AcrR family transcriptional regulator